MAKSKTKATTTVNTDVDPKVQEIYDEIFEQYTPDRLSSELETQPLQHIALAWMKHVTLDTIEECAIFDLDTEEYAIWLLYYHAFKMLQDTYINEVM